MSANSNSKAASPTAKLSNTTSTSKYAPQYIPLSRSWLVKSTSSYSHSTSASHTTTASHQGMTPMQRWESETLKQSYWTGVAEYEAPYGGVGRTDWKGQDSDEKGQQNWSMMGDVESERL